MSLRIPNCLRILAALKLRAMTVREIRTSLSADDDVVRHSLRKLCDAGLVEKRCQVPAPNNNVPAWLYGLTP